MKGEIGFNMYYIQGVYAKMNDGTVEISWVFARRLEQLKLKIAYYRENYDIKPIGKVRCFSGGRSGDDRHLILEKEVER